MGLFEPVLATALLGLTSVVVYRLLLHPLRNFPGPKLAAVTEYYQAYFDIVKGGELLNHLRELHGEYRPVIRIGPNTLYFATANAYHDIYTRGQSFTKHKQFYDCFGQPDSLISFSDPQESRSRRALLNPFFSRRAILKLEHVVQERAPDFRDPGLCAIHDCIPGLWKTRHFPILLKAVDVMPEWFTLSLHPSAKPALDLRRNLSTQVDKLLENKVALNAVDRETIYHHMLGPAENDAAASRHVSLTRGDLVDEALHSWELVVIPTFGTFHILQNPTIAQKLKDELKSVWPDVESPVGLNVLEKLSYLTAVIKESLRFGHGVVSPLPRAIGASNAIIASAKPAEWYTWFQGCDGLVIPASTIVEMSSVFLHENPDIFENPLNFSPERWLQGDTRELEYNLVPFSKGPRICLGLKYASLLSLSSPY
ncbi:benzoate 4-monooxygenase cytochrome p450 [Moniliophthora roreri]|nr:benzoate 4-monooxygenase cytochrome p450 [Moniliophthora roreri]